VVTEPIWQKSGEEVERNICCKRDVTQVKSKDSQTFGLFPFRNLVSNMPFPFLLARLKEEDKLSLVDFCESVKTLSVLETELCLSVPISLCNCFS